MKILLDACVVIDAIQSRKPFNDNAEKIFLGVANNKYEGYITAKSITDIYYLTHKCTHSDMETRKIISNLLTLFNVADTTEMDVKKAITSEMMDYEDAAMAETAERMAMDFIITRNLKDYSKTIIHVISPDEFVGRFKL